MTSNQHDKDDMPDIQAVPRFYDYCAWWLACVDEEAVSGDGVLMATPLETGDNVFDVRRKNGKCVAVTQHAGNRMNPGGSSVVYESACSAMRGWRSDCMSETQRYLELFEVDHIHHEELKSSSNICVHVMSKLLWDTPRRMDMHLNREDIRFRAIQLGYVRHRLKELGMPEDGRVPASQYLRDKLEPHIRDHGGYQLTWEVILRSLCNTGVSNYGNMGKVHDILGACETSFTLVIPRWTYYASAGVIRTVAGVARRDDLLSGKVTVDMFRKGEDHAAFLRRNPIVADGMNFTWVRIDKLRMQKK